MEFSQVRVKLRGESIAVAENGFLAHQTDTLNAIKNVPIVLNCAITGAGKTKASHLAIRQEALIQSVLYVAPTNALVYQHVQDARQFVDEGCLAHQVVGIDAAVLADLQRKYSAIHRPSEALYQVIYNPRNYAEELGIVESQNSAPLWLVTNPDQVWMSLVHGRGIDTRNLMQRFINHFRFVVVDEFHYYTAEQLVLFFLCIALWKIFGQFEDGLKLLLLTATPDELVETFFKRLRIEYRIVGGETSGVAGTVPVLAPIGLTLTTGSILDFSDDMLQLTAVRLTIK